MPSSHESLIHSSVLTNTCINFASHFPSDFECIGGGGGILGSIKLLMRRVTFCHKTEKPKPSSSSSSRLVVLYGVYSRTQRGASDRFVETRGVSLISLTSGHWREPRTGSSDTEICCFIERHPLPNRRGTVIERRRDASGKVRIHPHTSFSVSRGLCAGKAWGSRGKGEVRAHCCCYISS